MDQQNNGQSWNTVTAGRPLGSTGVGGVNGILTIPAAGPRKILSGLSFRWFWQGDLPTDATFTNPDWLDRWFVRVVVGTGAINPGQFGVQEDASGGPGNGAWVPDFNGVGGMGQIYVDANVRALEFFQMQFTRPIVVPGGQALTMFCSRVCNPNGAPYAGNSVQSNYMALYGADEGARDLNVTFR